MRTSIDGAGPTVRRGQAVGGPGRRGLGLGAALLALAIVSVLPACGDDDDAASAPPGPASTAPPATSSTTTTTVVPELPDPCELLTREDAEELTRLPVEEPRPVTNPETVSCAYGAPPTGPVGMAELFIGAGALQVLETDRRLGHDLRAVDDVGDEAYENDMIIYFRVGERWHVLRVVRIEDPSSYVEPIREVARRVVERS